MEKRTRLEHTSAGALGFTPRAGRMEATPSYEAVASGHARAAPKWGGARHGIHLLRGGWLAPQIIPRIRGARAWSMHGTVKPAKMLDTGKDQLDDWILGGWLGVQADPWDTTRMPRYAGGRLGAQGDPRDRTGMPRPMVLGPWMQRVDRHGWHLRTCQCQGGVGSQSRPSQDAPCPAWLPQEGALLLISQALVAQEGLHAQENSHRPLCPCLHLPPAGYQDSGLSCSRSRKTDPKAALHLLGTSSLRFVCLGVFIPSSILKDVFM